MSPPPHEQLVADLVTKLVEGWSERIEYVIPITMHTPFCLEERELLPEPVLKHRLCSCPQTAERRREARWQPSLLYQLCGATAGSTGEAYERVTTSVVDPRLPLDLDPLDLVEGIKVNAYSMAQQLGGAPSLGSRIDVVLRSLVSLVAVSEYEDKRYECVKMLRQMVRKARLILGYEEREKPLRDTSCGPCGGPLVVGADVRCLDCGHKYRRWEWIALLDASS
jgi:hypothetical protein